MIVLRVSIYMVHLITPNRLWAKVFCNKPMYIVLTSIISATFYEMDISICLLAFGFSEL